MKSVARCALAAGLALAQPAVAAGAAAAGGNTTISFTATVAEVSGDLCVGIAAGDTITGTYSYVEPVEVEKDVVREVGVTSSGGLGVRIAQQRQRGAAG
jgi:hypothetical protein